MPEGYEQTGLSTASGLTVFKNTHVPETKELTVTKVWDDNNNQDGVRPAELEITLSGSDGVTYTATMSGEGNTWTYTFEDLPVYYDNGKEVKYSVDEEDLSNLGYAKAIDGLTITNSRDAETKEVTVTKVWEDNSNQDGVRPAELEITLSGSDDATYTATMSGEGNTWTYTFEDLPVYYDNGKEVKYSVDEEDLSNLGYAKAIDGLTITNSRDAEITEVTVVKVWNDADNQDGKRPEELKVTLSNGTVVTLNEANEWTATIEGLPVYENGVEIEYSWTEEAVDGYTLTSTRIHADGKTTTLTNTHTPETTDLAVAKVWVDNDNQDGIRPENLVVTLSNGQSVTLNEGNEWTATIEGLPVYENGVEIEYSWTEAVVNGYELTDVSVEGNVTTLTNTHTPETTEATVVKVWADADNQDGKRPEELKVTLSNGTEVILSDANEWTATVTDLPKYVAGEEVVYSWTEATVDGYELIAVEAEGTVTTLTNAYETETVEVSGTKSWIDGNNVEGRPESITVNLFAGNKFVESTEVTAADNWTYSFTDLPKYAEGKVINYTISEDEVAGYDALYGGENGYDITNIIEQKQVAVSGEKIWAMPEDMELPVDEVIIDLYRDGVKVDSAAADVENGWAYAFTGLDKYDLTDGHVYKYTVAEATVVENFVSEVVKVSDKQFNIVNTYDRSSTTKVTVEKVWNDFDTNVETHSAITIKLYQNGVLYDTAELGEDSEWTMTFADLPKYDANQEPYEYTIGEVPVNGYTTSIAEVSDNSFVITNTLLLGEPGTITVTKQTEGRRKPADDVKYKFELQIQVIRPEGSNVLFDEAALMEEMDLGDATSALNDAIIELENSIGVVSDSEQYAYYLTEEAGLFSDEQQAVMAAEYEATTDSAIVFEENHGPVVTPEVITTGSMYEWFTDTREEIVEEILKLSNDFAADEIAELLAMLAENVAMSEEDGYAFALDYEALYNLMEAAGVYNALVAKVPGELETLVPSALQVYQTMNGTTTQSALQYVADGDYYTIHFWLANNESIAFNFEATSGSAIYYRIVETLDDFTSKYYVGTEIAENGMDVTTGTSYGFVEYGENSVMNYLFTNIYKNKAYIPTDDPEDPTPSVNPPEEPEEIIPDPEVPLDEPEIPEEPVVVPGEEIIEEPEVPLGDAPKTGDTNDAVPFMALMMFALAGLVVTRRKFN